MRIKCLPLDWWMTSRFRDETVTLGEYEEIPPRFMRPGRYLFGGYEWFEVDGRAWHCKQGMMQHDLRTLQASEMNHRQAEALRSVITERLATRRQREMFAAYMNAVELRSISRNARQYRLRCTRRGDRRES